MTGTRRTPREQLARVETVGTGTPAAGEVLVHEVALVNATFAESAGVQSLVVAERGGEPIYAAASASLALATGDVVTIDRRGNRWWIGGTVGSTS